MYLFSALPMVMMFKEEVAHVYPYMLLFVGSSSIGSGIQVPFSLVLKCFVQSYGIRIAIPELVVKQRARVRDTPAWRK